MDAVQALPYNRDDVVSPISPMANLSSSPRPSYARAPTSNPNFSSLPPLMTQVPTRSAIVAQRGVNKRLSTISAAFTVSRPQSDVFPFFLSSLSYSLVRDFAYSVDNPLHYGPPPEGPSSAGTPGSEHSRRMSEAFIGSKWTAYGDSYFGITIPTRRFGDGPPYAEDEELLSPVVTTTRHRKSRSTANEFGSMFVGGRTSSLATSVQNAGDDDEADAKSKRQISGMLIVEPGQYTSEPQETDSPAISPTQPYNHDYDDESRYSRHYQFSIASPDEEYHGKAVALFDFQRENDNELPFVEGQVLYVSYRHGEGWLVAQDPKSGESGLVPEQYVRLLRDIEGGLSGLKGEGYEPESPGGDFDTPVDVNDRSEGSKYYRPVVSSFSTSSKDLERYHFANSQQTTPTAPSRKSFEELPPGSPLKSSVLDATTFTPPPRNITPDADTANTTNDEK